MLVVVEPAVDSFAVLEVELALGGFPLARLVLVIFKHLCGEEAEVSPLPSLEGGGHTDTEMCDSLCYTAHYGSGCGHK